jgi:hypothetical protein
MGRQTVATLVALLLLALRVPASGAAAPDTDTETVTSALWRRTPFVIGAPGRLDGHGDVRYPRRYLRADSSIGAYVDIEEVDDPTWLQHEVEHYARRAVDCAGVGESWCRREIRPLAAGRVVFLTAGVHAELVWVSRQDVAVRLGWQRVVVAPTGSMTVDAPPSNFAAALLGEFPSQLGAIDFDADGEALWADREVDRLLYYADEVIAALADVGSESHRRHALRFIEDNLAQIAVIAPAAGTAPWDDRDAGVEGTEELPLPLARRLAAIRASRLDRGSGAVVRGAAHVPPSIAPSADEARSAGALPRAGQAPRRVTPGWRSSERPVAHR